MEEDNIQHKLIPLEREIAKYNKMYRLSVMMVVVLIAMVLGKCHDHETRDTCLEDCSCAWCVNTNINLTACITYTGSEDICNVWGRVDAIAEETQECIDREARLWMYALLMMTAVIVVCSLIIGAGVWFVYSPHRADTSKCNSPSVPPFGRCA